MQGVLTRGDTPATGERIPLVPLLAATHRIVHNHCTLGAGGTGPRAWVPALLVDAGPVARALAVDEALGPAVGRHAHVSGQAGAGRHAADVAALGVATAGVGHAGVGGSRRFRANPLSCL
jgi:hypothetical protein